MQNTNKDGLCRFREFFEKALFWTVLCFFQTFFLYAAPSTPSAGSEEARLKQQRFREESVLPPAGEETGVAEAKLESRAPVSAEAVFYIRRFRFMGNRSVSSKELRKAAHRWVRREVRLSQLRQAAEEVKNYYRSRGYLSAYAYIPPQIVHSGIVEMRIVEGRLGKLEISGNRFFSSELLSRLLHLKKGAVLRYDALRRGLERINQPDVQARAVLKPGLQTGTTDMEIQVKDRLPLHLSVETANSGTEDTGRQRTAVTLTHANLMGRLDRVLARFQAGTGAWSVFADYSGFVNEAAATRAGFSFSKTSVNVGGGFKVLGLEGDATTYGVYLSQPFIEEKNLDVGFRGGFDWKSAENRALGAVSGKDELRILDLGFDLDGVDPSGWTRLSCGLGLGFSSFLGASDKVDEAATRAGTGGEFLALRGRVTRFHRVWDEIVFFAHANGQWTPDALTPFEQLSLGGSRSVRGYQEGEYTSDSGVVSSLELLVPFYLIPENWRLPLAKVPLRHQLQFVGFADVGYGSLEKPLVGEKPERFLAGAGGGLRMRLYEKTYARFEWAAPIGDKPVDGRKSAFYFTVSMELI